MASWVWRRYDWKQKQRKYETIKQFLLRGGKIKKLPPETQATSFQFTQTTTKAFAQKELTGVVL